MTGEPGYSDPHASETGSASNTNGARGAAQDVAGDATEAGRAVKDTAAQEAAGVKDDAVREAKRLGGEAGTVLESQAAEQLDRAAGTVRSFSDDVARIARGEKPEPGVAKDLVDQLNSRAEATASWLEDHDPREVLHEVQSFARRRPVAFLAIAAGVGFAAGRFTRGLKQNHADDAQPSSSTSNHRATSASGHPARHSTPETPAGAAAGTAPTPGTAAGNASGPAPGTSAGTASGPVPGTIPAGGTDPYAGGAGR
ncbi:hypothetical protein I2485_13130 [Nesterenkonia sp. E16_7]|uniref:hypothetical protein n=1 Tax=unclassified Nesterenkonia TaxID=2629769 RepID=UPI001A929301|nr:MULTISPECIES: hypothetical protein [unclassified Nesterenkonia]MBO0595816.1 hypothetical protein [Nesterenkonia sp. E16_10]MBO0599585.1 hypothetical protein [Nesterenkonia sp. E16_7]